MIFSDKEEQNSVTTWKLKVQNQRFSRQSHLFMYIKYLNSTKKNYKMLTKVLEAVPPCPTRQTHLCSDLYLGTINIMLFHFYIIFLINFSHRYTFFFK